MRPLRIYLADLTHVGNGVATEAFPLNIGLISTYAAKRLGKDVTIRLFKYPADLQEALNQRPPDILGCSNYTWNFYLSYEFCRMAKAVSKETITVFGGTNYPFAAQEQESFLRRLSDLDVHVFYEGEQAFVNLLERVLGHGTSALTAPVAGCQHLHPETGAFLNGEKIARIRSLDEIPSPYSSGLLDSFFDGKLTPLVETARGCPFRCNFCNAGDSYFTSVNLFSDEYVKEELTYIARMASGTGSFHVTFADNNFGMIPRDSKTAELLHSLYETYQWPKSVSIWTGKNSKARVIDVTRVLGDQLSISMSVQSMDPTVLKNIRRENIKLDHYRDISDELNAQGRPQHAEVIMPLPGETLESHIRGLRDLLDTGVSNLFSHTLQMLHGTPYKDDPFYRASYGYQTRFRIVPLDFSQVNGKPIFDVEEVAVATNSLSFEEYVQARVFLMVIDLCYNNGTFDLLKRYLLSKRVPISKWIQTIYERRDQLSEGCAAVFSSFGDETRSELWESERDLVAHYSEPGNYQKLLNYQEGGNVLFKHRVWMLSMHSEAWVGDVCRITYSWLNDLPEGIASGIPLQEFHALERFVTLSVKDCFSIDGVEKAVIGDFGYDLLGWLASGRAADLSEFLLAKPIQYRFFIPEVSIGILQDAFRRYGTDLSGLVKLVQRTAGAVFSRKAAYAESAVLPARIDTVANRLFGPGHASM